MYQVLARKWRPKNFHELVGQAHVAQALTYALDHNRIHHAYLFTGTRGVGKTTIARIFAKSLNCQKNQISSNPCGECDHCLEIDQGRFPDLLEVDAASRTGVDDTRELLDNVPYAPVKGRFKVYLIDEVHMFSKSSFNALLKTLEEPPAHVKFILATTDPQKLPATILSRCLQFHLKNMSESQIAGHLSFILEKENATFEPEALRLLAHAASGSMRDSLSLLDQALAYGQGKITTHDVATLLGAVSTPQLLNLLETMINQDARNMRGILATLDEYAPDYSALLQSLLQCLQKISIVQLDAQRPEDEIPQKLQQMAIRLPVELTQLWYQIATDTWQNLPYQPDARTALEMGLLRMIALQPVLPQTDLEKVRPVPEAKQIEDGASFSAMVANLQDPQTSLAEEKTFNNHGNISPSTEPREIDTTGNNARPQSEQNSNSTVNHGNVSPNVEPRENAGNLSAENTPPWQNVPQQGTGNNPLPQSESFSQSHEINDSDPYAHADIPPWDYVPENIADWDENTPQTWQENSPTETQATSQNDEVNREKKPFPTTGKTLDESASEWINDIAAWSDFLLTLPLGNFPLMLLESSCPYDWQSPVLSLFFDKAGENFNNPQNIEKAEQALNQFFNTSCQLTFTFQADLLTPNMFYQQQREKQERERRENFLAHPMVKAAQAVFGEGIRIDNIQSTKQE